MKALSIFSFAILAALAGCGEKEAAAPAPAPQVEAPAPAPTPAPVVEAPAAEQPAPAAAVADAGPAASAEDLVKGEKIYKANCIACHGSGVMGAPKPEDKAAWAPRVAAGMETVYTHAINGVKLMPPRGGNASLKDEEVKAAVDYMVSKAL